MGDIERVHHVVSGYGVGKAPVRIGYNPNRRQGQHRENLEEPEDQVVLGDVPVAESSQAEPDEDPVSETLDVVL